MKFYLQKQYSANRSGNQWALLCVQLSFHDFQHYPCSQFKTVREYQSTTDHVIWKIDVFAYSISLLVVRLFSCSMHIPSHWLVRCCVVTATQQELDKMIKRNAALSALFKRLYKDNVLGKIAMSSSRCCLLTTTPSRSNWPQPYQRNRHGWRSWKLLPPTWYLHWES